MDIGTSCFGFDARQEKLISIQIWVNVPKLKLNPLLVMQQHNAKLSLCSAYVTGIGLLGSNVLFSMPQSSCGRVAVRAGLHFVCLLARLSVQLTQRNTYQQLLVSVIDELWWGATAEGHHVSDRAATSI